MLMENLRRNMLAEQRPAVAAATVKLDSPRKNGMLVAVKIVSFLFAVV